MLRTLKAIPTLLRIGVAETVAYRAEFLVWILTTTLPLVMLGLWTSVADEAPFAGYKSQDFVAYYLSVLVVRNLTSNWVAWQIAEEIRQGQLAMRLLRPIHPFIAYAMQHLAALPLRAIVSSPIAIILLLSSGSDALIREPAQLALVVPSIACAWLIAYALLFCFGALAFWVTKTMAITNVYFAAFTTLSGYLMPLPLVKPHWLVTIASATPFPSMLYAPVSLMTQHLAPEDAVRLVGIQAAWAGGCIALALLLWRAGVRRFEAVGS